MKLSESDARVVDASSTGGLLCGSQLAEVVVRDPRSDDVEDGIRHGAVVSCADLKRVSDEGPKEVYLDCAAEDS